MVAPNSDFDSRWLVVSGIEMIGPLQIIIYGGNRQTRMTHHLSAMDIWGLHLAGVHGKGNNLRSCGPAWSSQRP